MDRIRACFVSLATVGCVFTGAESVLAEPSSDNLFGMSLQDVLAIDVETASKLGLKAGDSPGNLTIITQDQIKRYGYRTVGEALGRVPGFLTTRLSGHSSTGARGLSPLGVSFNSRILFLIDGLKHNDWLSDGSSVDDAFPLDIETVDRIEVVKGDGSAIWGTNALYGVVNVISKDGSSKLNKQFLAEHRSDNRGKGYLSWGGESDSGIKFFGSASYTKSRGDLDVFYPAPDGLEAPPSYMEGRSQLDGYHFNGKLTYEDFYANIVFGMDDRLTDNTIAQFYNLGGSTKAQSSPLRAEIGYKSPSAEKGDTEFRFRVFHSQDRNRTTSDIPDLLAPGTTYYDNRRISFYTTGAELLVTKQIVDEVKVVAGFEVARSYKGNVLFESHQTDGEQVTDLSDSKFSFPYRTTASPFFDLMYAPFKEISFFFGGRLEKATELDAAFAPRIGLVSKPLDDTTIKLSASRGFRNPAVAEYSEIGGEQLTKEKVESIEATAEHQFSDAIALKLGAFHTNLKDTIGINPEVSDIFYVNLPGFNSTGAELELKVRSSNELEGYFSYSYSEAHDNFFDSEVSTFPNSIFRTGISLGNPEDLVSVTPELVMTDSTRSSVGTPFSGSTLLNLTVLSELGITGFSISGSIYNIFDERFSRPDYLFPLVPVVERSYEVGRQFRVQASYHF